MKQVLVREKPILHVLNVKFNISEDSLKPTTSFLHTLYNPITVNNIMRVGSGNPVEMEVDNYCEFKRNAGIIHSV